MNDDGIEAKVSRAYRYALRLTPGQEKAVQRQERQLRHAWNKLVNWQRCAMRDWEYGRRSQLLVEIGKIVEGKKLVGAAIPKARERAGKSGVSLAEAVALNRQQALAKKQRYGPRRLAVELAQERLLARADNFYGGQKCLLYGLVQKFQKSCEVWLKHPDRMKAPRYKRDQDGVALQRQITQSSACVLGKESDLSSLIGQAGKRCRTVWHRFLPDQAVVKQLAIAGRAGRRFLIVSFTCPRQSVLKPFGKSESMAGIDTGYACALTVVSNAYVENRKLRREVLDVDARLGLKLADDLRSKEALALAGAVGNLEGFIFLDDGAIKAQPPLARNKKFLMRLRRLERKRDRQKRAANPDCFNADGTWKKGKRARNVTNNLLKTHVEVQRLNERVVDSRRDFYHKFGFNLLRQHGLVKMSNWQPKPLKKAKKRAKKGDAKRRRNMNRKGLDHAIKSFQQILKDKASLAANPRTVEIVSDARTTRTCACCKSESGPQGPTNVAKWFCSVCGAENNRKANAAENIRDK